MYSFNHVFLFFTMHIIITFDCFSPCKFWCKLAFAGEITLQVSIAVLLFPPSLLITLYLSLIFVFLFTLLMVLWIPEKLFNLLCNCILHNSSLVCADGRLNIRFSFARDSYKGFLLRHNSFSYVIVSQKTYTRDEGSISFGRGDNFYSLSLRKTCSVQMWVWGTKKELFP